LTESCRSNAQRGASLLLSLNPPVFPRAQDRRWDAAGLCSCGVPCLGSRLLCSLRAASVQLCVTQL